MVRPSHMWGFLWLRRAVGVAFLFVAAVEVRAEDALYVPHVVVGPLEVSPGQIIEFGTRFRYINLTDREIRVDVELISDSGDPINVFDRICGFLCIEPVNTRGAILKPFGRNGTSANPALSSSLQIGWARFTFSGTPGGSVATADDAGISVELVLYGPSGAVLNSTTIEPEQPVDAFSAFADRDAGIAVLNPSDIEQAEVTFTLLSGDTTIGVATVSLSPLGKIAKFLDDQELFGDLDMPPFGETLEVRSSVPVVVAIVRTDDMAWSTLPSFPPRDIPDVGN